MHALLLLISTLFAQTVFAQTSAEKPGELDRAQLETWLDQDGAGDKIKEAFRTHPDQVLPFFDHYLEGGLSLIEKGEPVAKAEESFKKGEAFAKLASAAFSDDIFEKYAKAFANWSADQQKQFRKGQKLFGQGRASAKDGKHAEALAAYLESFDLAQPLGDAWGMAMAQAGIASSKKELSEWQMAAMHSREAFAINARLRLYDATLKAFEDWVTICRGATVDGKDFMRPIVAEKPSVPKANEALGLALAYTEYDLKDYQLARRIREAWNKLPHD